MEFGEEFSEGICRVKWFSFEVVQSTPQLLIDSRFCLLAKWLSQLKVVCWLKWMPWIPLFWVLLMLVVEFSCFAICVHPCIFHSNYMPMSLCLFWIRGPYQIRPLGVYCFFVRSIFRWWCTRNIVYGYIISWLAYRWPFRCTNWSQTIMARVDPILQMVNSCPVIVHQSSILGDSDDSESWVGSRRILSPSR